MKTQDILDALSNLKNASKNVVDKWESGDLATAVTDLDGSADHAQEILDKAYQHRDHFHLVFAEVAFIDHPKRRDVKGTRVNIFTKAMDLQFSAGRLNHIQNAAAMQAREEVGQPPHFEIVNVNILGLYPLGQFTDEEFYAGIRKVESPIAAPPALSVVAKDPTKN